MKESYFLEKKVSGEILNMKQIDKNSIQVVFRIYLDSEENSLFQEDHKYSMVLSESTNSLSINMAADEALGICMELFDNKKYHQLQNREHQEQWISAYIADELTAILIKSDLFGTWCPVTFQYELRKENMEIEWREWEKIPDFSKFGHGVRYFDSRKGELKQDGLIAWLEGYNWLHEDPAHVLVWCIPPDEISTKEFLDKVKLHINDNIYNREVFGTENLENLFIWPNA